MSWSSSIPSPRWHHLQIQTLMVEPFSLKTKIYSPPTPEARSPFLALEEPERSEIWNWRNSWQTWEVRWCQTSQVRPPQTEDGMNVLWSWDWSQEESIVWNSMLWKMEWSGMQTFRKWTWLNKGHIEAYWWHLFHLSRGIPATWFQVTHVSERAYPVSPLPPGTVCLFLLPSFPLPFFSNMEEYMLCENIY